MNAKDAKGYTAYAMTGDKKLQRLLIKAGRQLASCWLFQSVSVTLHASSLRCGMGSPSPALEAATLGSDHTSQSAS